MEAARKQFECLVPDDSAPQPTGLLGQAMAAANLSFEQYFRVVLLLVLLAIGIAAWAWRNDAVRTIEMIRTDSREEGRADRDLFQRELKYERELFREQSDLTRKAIEKLDTSIGRLVEKIR